MKILTLSLSLMFSLSVFAAAQLTALKMDENGFHVSIPKEWENVDKKKLKEPVMLSVINKEKEASLIILGTTESKMSCKEFLASTDASRNTKNNLVADKQAASAELLKASDATEGALGEYEIQGKGPGFPVAQRSVCLKNKDQIRVLTGAWQKKKSAQYEPIFKDVFASFKFVPVTKPTAEKKK